MIHPPSATAVKAVIFDVYHTLLAVEDGPTETAGRWDSLWTGFFSAPPPFSLTSFDAACRDAGDGAHARRRAEGRLWPEVDWRAVACEAAPALSGLERASLDAFLFGHARLQRTTRAMPGAAAFLTGLKRRGILTGIASNAQRYTLDELAAAGLPATGFARELCFWSFQQGFSKPDPAVFFWLSQRLAMRGISPEETLMIGDRLDNDVQPAKAAGWQTWHFQKAWPKA